jgi:hypothetical protein
MDTRKRGSTSEMQVTSIRLESELKEDEVQSYLVKDRHRVFISHCWLGRALKP